MTGGPKDRVWGVVWTVLPYRAAYPRETATARIERQRAADALRPSDAEALHRRLFGAARDETAEEV